MKKATQDLILVNRGNLNYYLSILEKENESGIMFNQRIFFLLSGHHIGYLSEVKMTETPDKINFQKPKMTILLTSIKSILHKDKEVTIKFIKVDNNKSVERIWLLRMESQDLAKKWYDKLQQEKISSINKKERALQPVPEPQPQKKPQIPAKVAESPTKERKNFEIRRNIQVSSIVRKDKEFKQMKEIGIGNSPRKLDTQSPTRRNKQEQLSKIMNQSNSRVTELKYISPPKGGMTDRSQSKTVDLKRQDSQSIRSQPAHKRLEMPTKRYYDNSLSISKEESRISQQSESKRQSSPSSKMQDSLARSRKQPSPESAKDEPRITLNNTYTLNNQKYTGDNESSRSDLKSQKSTDKIVIRDANRLPIPNQEDQYDEKLNPKSARLNLSHSREIQKSYQQSQTDSSDVPWTYKYIKWDYLIFDEFNVYTKILLQDIIFDMKTGNGFRKYKPKLVKQNIHYFDVKDIEVKIATMELNDLYAEGESQGERVCNKAAIKTLTNEFHNFQAISYFLPDNSHLKVPLVTLCQYMGFVALFKVTSKHVVRQIRIGEVERQLNILQSKSQIRTTFGQNLRKVIILLDANYYDSFKRGEDNTNFHCYFIQEIDSFLPADLASDQPYNYNPIVRRELLTSINKEDDGNILKAISGAVVELDCMQKYFLSSNELAQWLHEKGISLRYLGHVYQHLQTPFQRRLLMSEISARCCKNLMRKTIQDIVIEQGKISPSEFQIRICDFLNCVLGNSYETAAIWKVLSSHSSAYYGLPLNFDQIDRSHFLLSLIQNCRLDIAWQRVHQSQAFKTNLFFSDRNFKGLNPHFHNYQPINSYEYQLVEQILSEQENPQGFQEMVRELNLTVSTIPTHLKHLLPRMKQYISFFVSPENAMKEFAHLELFGEREGKPTKAEFDVRLIEIKWWLKAGKREEYIRCCDSYLGRVGAWFGQFHPAFSQLYDLFSAYHLGRGEFEDAITFAKSSLVNILKICGSTHERTAQCYYHLALCYIRGGRREQAMSHVRKAKLIFQTTNRTHTLPYAHMLLKLALLHLNQGQLTDCITAAATALNIFQNAPQTYEDQLTQTYELLTRCMELTHQKSQMRALGRQCAQRLVDVRNPVNMEKFLKMALYPVLSELSAERAACLLDLIGQLPLEATEQHCLKGSQMLRERIEEQSLFPNLLLYLDKIEAIDQNIRENRILEEWNSFEQTYTRETVRDFLALTAELMLFLGEGFLTGALREAL